MRNARKRFIWLPTRAAHASVALALFRDHVGRAQSLLLREELRDRRELLLIDTADDAGHDRILALAALVVLERLNDVVGLLTREDRIFVGDRLGAVGAVARDAGL